MLLRHSKTTQRFNRPMEYYLCDHELFQDESDINNVQIEKN